MTGNTADLPADLHRWVAGQLPGLASHADASWPRGDSRVWRVASDTEAAYVKICPTPDGYRREVVAYRHATSALPAKRAPQLLAADPDLQAVLTSPLAGQVVRDLPLAPETQAQVHTQAGRLLRRWHDLPEPIPASDREAFAASMAEQTAEAAQILQRVGDRLTGAERTLLSGIAELPDLAAGLPLVFLHGDYSPRNWLWDQPSGSVGVIDFETVGHGLAVQDMVWLRGAVWPEHPGLRQAFLTGYGRHLTAVEERVLLLLTARLAASYLATGLAKQDAVLTERGRKALTDLAPER